MHILLIGASGRLGRSVLGQGRERRHTFTAQTRTSGKISESSGIRAAVGDPTDRPFLDRAVPGHDAVLFVLGIDHRRSTTLFSDATRALLEAMRAAGVRRLVAVTGIGAGDTRGHGGWFYNLFVFPLLTRNRYRDKDKQEALIEASGLDWTIVRPAPFSDAAPEGALRVYEHVPPGLQLNKVNPHEVATFILEELEQGRYVHKKPFIGHPSRASA